MSGDINPNPGPVSASTFGKINCLVMNARSLSQRPHNVIAKTAQQIEEEREERKCFLEN